MADKYWWGLVTRLPDGHRLFPEHGGEGRIAIADNSAREPQESDDGVLWLDMEWNLIVSSPDNIMCIPVKRDRDGERFSTITDVSTLMYLSAEFEWPIEDQFMPNNEVYRVIKELRS